MYLKSTVNIYFPNLKSCIKNDSTLHISGSGLGLNIATQLAKMSDIKMRIESSQNIGTKIILTLNIENF